MAAIPATFQSQKTGSSNDVISNGNHNPIGVFTRAAFYPDDRRPPGRPLFRVDKDIPYSDNGCLDDSSDLHGMRGFHKKVGRCLLADSLTRGRLLNHPVQRLKSSVVIVQREVSINEPGAVMRTAAGSPAAVDVQESRIPLQA